MFNTISYKSFGAQTYLVIGIRDNITLIQLVSSEESTLI